ncbi:hypothetical protein [Stakelama tenebrarum]|uniref:DUF4760 domain-containing protein n=1 Tax=Stakelama tenebrarum TaxID=2711215 RepID=A0A6G6Y745_9SPHN|nr:hypothetical protein [Sphingosinithalassobacter tenebrarum]QIG80671.1 hypothetical protein G5C33_13370 [Sphingosinithalassobacter tenebrarum]
MQDWIFDHLEGIGAVISALVAIFVALAAWINWRRTELRRDDVLDWANEAIAAIQTVRQIVASSRMRLTAAEERARLSQAMLDTSILIERGRLFFRNTRAIGQRDTERAYRGKRPEILDQLVLAHQIACAWPTASATDREKMRVVITQVTRRFVTLLQTEVGRERTASPDTRRRGDGADLAARLAEIA